MKELGYMNCLTGLDIYGYPIDLTIRGPDENSPNRRLELVFQPCVPD